MKTPFKKFMIRCVLYIICGLLTIMLFIGQGQPLWIFFSIIFFTMAYTNYRFAIKHKDDISVVDVALEKYKEVKEQNQKEVPHKMSKKEKKRAYKERLKSIEAEFEFEYDDDDEYCEEDDDE